MKAIYIEVSVPPRIIRALAPLTSKDDRRQQLQHIYLHPVDDETIRAVATDFYLIGIVEFKGHMDAGTSVLVPASVAKHIDYRMVPDIIIRRSDNILDVCIENMTISHLMTISEFVEYEHAMKGLQDTPAPCVGLNADFLARVAKAHKTLHTPFSETLKTKVHGTSEPVEFSSGGTGSSLLFRAYIMPTMIKG